MKLLDQVELMSGWWLVNIILRSVFDVTVLLWEVIAWWNLELHGQNQEEAGVLDQRPPLGNVRGFSEKVWRIFHL